ncbi:MAG TPA: hypothetical protein VGL29_08480 [Blastocatellia bacterium]
MNDRTNADCVNERMQKRTNIKQPASVGASDRLRTTLRWGAVAGLLLLSTACNSKTVLLANFNSDTVGAPPASAQNTGTVQVDPGGGSVTVVDAPPGLPANKWVHISHPTQPSPQTGMRGVFSQFDGPGKYGLVCSLYIPSGTGAVTVQFEPFVEPNEYFGFMHLDFMPEGDVRIDDDESKRFGHFPRDQSFVLSVNLVITSTTATARATLLGSGASGDSGDININNPFARQFGAVRFWMGFQWRGSFFADDILVTRQN